MRRALGLTLLLMLSCGRERLHGVEGGIQVAATELAFPRTFVGYPSTQTLELTNSAPAARTVTLTAGEPYTVARTFTVQPASKLAVPVRFSPATKGPHPSTLEVISEGKSVSVALVGNGAEAPVCATGSTCSPVHFDPSTGTCIITAAADGTTCSGDACLVNATCRAGQCAGQARSCEDGSACTADSCDPVRGCIHTDSSANCPASSDPCKVPTCSVSGGCGQADASDGTVCGSVSCAQAHVCILGSCRAVTPPDGFECAPASPCQAHGTCQQGQCAQPQATVLQPRWKVPVADGLRATHRISNFIADERGDLFVQASDDYYSEDRIVSVTPTGLLRFAMNPRQGANFGDLIWLIAAGGKLVTSTYGGHARIFSAADGHLEVEPNPDLGGVPMVAAGGVIAASVWDNIGYGGGRVQPRTFFLDGGAAVAFSAMDGGLKWVAASDGTQTVFTLEDNMNGTESWAVARDLSGKERWRRSTIWLDVLAVVPEANLFLSRSGGYAIDDGHELFAGDGGAGSVSDGRFLFEYRNGGQIVARRASTGQDLVAWTLPPDGGLSGELFMTARASLLVSSFTPSARQEPDHSLRELNLDGGVGWVCPLPREVDALVHGYWELLENEQFFRLTGTPDGGSVIEAYDLPGVSLAPHGWVMSGGNPGRSNAPR